VYDDNGNIRYWEFEDSAIEIKYKTDAMINEINDTIPNMISDSIQHAIDSSKNYTDLTINDSTQYVKSLISYYTVSYYSDLPTGVGIGSKGYVNFDGKEYIYNGIIWNEVTGSELKLGSKTIREIYQNESIESSNRYGYTYADNSVNSTVSVIAQDYNDRLFSSIYGLFTLSGINSIGSFDIWITRTNEEIYDSVLRIGSTASDQFSFVAPLPNGDIVILADPNGSTVYINGWYNDTIAMPSSNQDVIYMKFDENLNVKDSATVLMYGSGLQFLHSAKVDLDGNIFFTGIHTGTSTVGDTSITANSFTCPIYGKIDTSGNVVYVRQILSGDNSNRLYAFKFYDNRLFVAGDFEDYLEFPDTTFTGDPVNRWGILFEINPDNGNLINNSDYVKGGDDLYTPYFDIDEDGNLYFGGPNNGTSIEFTDVNKSGITAGSNYVIKTNLEFDTSYWDLNIYTGQVMGGIVYNKNIVYMYGLFSNTVNYGTTTIDFNGSSELPLMIGFNKDTKSMVWYDTIFAYNDVQTLRGSAINDRYTDNILWHTGIQADSVILNDTVVDIEPSVSIFYITEIGYNPSISTILELKDEEVILGDYSKNNYVGFNDSSLYYSNEKSNYSGTELPTMYAVEQKISEIDSNFNTVYTDNLEGSTNDTMEVNDNVDLNEGIRLRVDTISFSVSMTFDFKGQATTQVITMTNNADLDITVPKGGFYEIEVYQDGTGGRTLTVDGASKATNSGDQSTDADAVSLYQFRQFANDSTYYWIDTP
jgi:hypothetical protein